MAIRQTIVLRASHFGVLLIPDGALTPNLRRKTMKKTVGLKVRTKVRSGWGNWPH
jgi:hypothetical protein